jgi:hypothetical protein
MSLTLNTRAKTINGISVDTAYGRVAATDSFKGDAIQGALDWYATEADFLAGATPIYLEELPTTSYFPYDRDVESKDILDLAHENFVAIYGDKGFSVTKQL